MDRCFKSLLYRICAFSRHSRLMYLKPVILKRFWSIRPKPRCGGKLSILHHDARVEWPLEDRCRNYVLVVDGIQQIRLCFLFCLTPTDLGRKPVLLKHSNQDSHEFNLAELFPGADPRTCQPGREQSSLWRLSEDFFSVGFYLNPTRRLPFHTVGPPVPGIGMNGIYVRSDICLWRNHDLLIANLQDLSFQ